MQDSPIRPQSNDIRRGNLRRASLCGLCPVPGTVTFKEEEVPDAEESSEDEAMAVDEVEKEAEGAVINEGEG